MPMIIVFLILLVIALVYVFQGVGMHNQVTVEEGKFHALQSDYLSNSKAIRDGAESNSALTAQLAQIQNYPSELLRLKLVGVGKILTGIFVVLVAILMALVMMPIRLGKVIYDHMAKHKE